MSITPLKLNYAKANRLVDSHWIGCCLYILQSIIVHGLFLYYLLPIFLPEIADPVLIIFLYVLLLGHVVSQYAYIVPIFFLLQDAGYPSMAKSFLYTSFIPLIFIIGISFYVYNYVVSNNMLPPYFVS